MQSVIASLPVCISWCHPYLHNTNRWHMSPWPVNWKCLSKKTLCGSLKSRRPIYPDLPRLEVSFNEAIDFDEIHFLSFYAVQRHRSLQKKKMSDHMASSPSSSPAKKKESLGWMEWMRGWSSVFGEILFQRITASHLENPLPLPSVNDLTCVVTGSTSGIGRETARFFLSSPTKFRFTTK